MSVGVLTTTERPQDVDGAVKVGTPAPNQERIKIAEEKLNKRIGEMTFVHRVRLRLCAWMIKFVAKHGRELLINYVMEKASEISVKTTMAILTREGIAHCYVCPSRFPLRRVGNRYACHQHLQEVQAHSA